MIIYLFGMFSAPTFFMKSPMVLNIPDVLKTSPMVLNIPQITQHISQSTEQPHITEQTSYKAISMTLYLHFALFPLQANIGNENRSFPWNDLTSILAWLLTSLTSPFRKCIFMPVFIISFSLEQFLCLPSELLFILTAIPCHSCTEAKINC